MFELATVVCAILLIAEAVTGLLPWTSALVCFGALALAVVLHALYCEE